MKVLFYGIIPFALIVACTSNTGISNQQTSGINELSRAIRDVSDYLNKNSTSGPSVQMDSRVGGAAGGWE